MVAVGDDRPAVVAAALDAVDLVAAHRAHLVRPQPAGGVERDAQQIAMPQRPDLRRNPAPPGKWIVGRHRAIGLEPDHLAQVLLQVLGRVELLAVARGDPQFPVGAEGDAMAVVPAAAHLRRLPPHHLPVQQAAARPPGVQRKPRTPHHRAACIAGTGLGIAQVDELVAGEPRMRHHVAQPALAAIGDCRHAEDVADAAGRGIEQLELAGLLGDQQAPIGQEGHRPGFVEARELGGDEWRVGFAQRRLGATGAHLPWRRGRRHGCGEADDRRGRRGSGTRGVRCALRFGNLVLAGASCQRRGEYQHGNSGHVAPLRNGRWCSTTAATRP